MPYPASPRLSRSILSILSRMFKTSLSAFSASLRGNGNGSETRQSRLIAYPPSPGLPPSPSLRWTGRRTGCRLTSPLPPFPPVQLWGAIPKNCAFPANFFLCALCASARRAGQGDLRKRSYRSFVHSGPCFAETEPVNPVHPVKNV